MQSTDHGRDGADWRKIRNPYFRVTAMLAKLTSKNQLTLPKAVVNQYPGTTYFEVRAEKGRIVLVPARVASLEGVWAKMESLGLGEKDVEDAVKWARKRK